MSKSKFNFIHATDEELQNDAKIFKKMKFSGVLPSPEDSRDFVAGAQEQATFPKEYQSIDTDILNQGSVGSCVPHALVAAMARGEVTLTKAFADYSRGYIYGNRRDADYQGEGMVIRQALKQLNHCGDVLQEEFPYNKTYDKVTELIEKDKAALAEKALPHAIVEYFRCYDEAQIKKTIMEKGCVIISVPVYSDFSRDLHVTRTNIEKGGHAMIIIGWTADGKWIVQNSWGALWGYGGKLLMDANYPVNEYWGITVKAENIVPDKKSIFEKIIDFIVGTFNKIFKKNI